MSAGRLIGQEVSSVNSLSFAAIAMLLFSPHLLFDVSFQLSFAAVLSILLLAPPLQAIFRVYEHGVLYAYVVNLLILSFVAQAGTLPFVWYYFGVFPLYFLLTNLFVVPLSFVLMLLAVIVWMLAPIAFLQSAVAWLLGAVADVMNWGVEAVASLPGASFSLPPLGLCWTLLLTFAVLLLVIALLRRHVWLVVLSLGLVLFFVLSIAMDNNDMDEEDGYMLLYNNRKNPLVHLVFGSGENCLLSTVPQSDAEYEGVSMPYVKRGKLRQPVWVDWGYADSIVQYNDGLFSFGGLSVRLLDNAHWRENVYAEPVDILVLCRGFLGSVKEVVEVYPASCVVLDGSLYKRSRERILRECSRLGVEAVDIASEGAMKVVVTPDGFDLIPMKGK
jgi:competence protein ComEC